MNKLREIVDPKETFIRDGVAIRSKVGRSELLIARTQAGMGSSVDGMLKRANIAPELLAVVEAARLLDQCDSDDCECQNCKTLRAVAALDSKLVAE